MGKERLEEIEVQGYENDGDNRLFVKLKEDDYLYLREQTERVQELEKAKQMFQDDLLETVVENARMKEQNKRYREAIEKAIEKLTWNSVESEKILLDVLGDEE